MYHEIVKWRVVHRSSQILEYSDKHSIENIYNETLSDDFGNLTDKVNKNMNYFCSEVALDISIVNVKLNVCNGFLDIELNDLLCSKGSSDTE